MGVFHFGRANEQSNNKVSSAFSNTIQAIVNCMGEVLTDITNHTFGTDTQKRSQETFINEEKKKTQ